MRKKWMHEMGILLSGVLLAQAVCCPVEATDLKETKNFVISSEQSLLSDETGIVVTTRSEFTSALMQKKSPITISGTISIGDEADESTGKMYPLEIPGDTIIQGAEDARLNCRCPVQITGDNVTMKNIDLVFESSDALGSIPHREIFLAGHSLTLDNVETYLEGGDGSLGAIGGSEDELLPTVYAGGFENTSIGTNAALTIQNANSKTMFQGIYMSHGEEDSKVSYTGMVALTISPQTIVRDGIYTDNNSSAAIEITGNGNISNMKFYGNDRTTLDVKQANMYQTVIEKVGTLILDEKGYLELCEGSLENVILKKGACLDLNLMSTVSVSGNFTGGAYNPQTQVDERGILVLNMEGTLNIFGTVSQNTIFCTGNYNTPGEYISQRQYIKATKETDTENGFMLPDSKKENYQLLYESDGWTVYNSYIKDYPVIGSIEIVSAPAQVDISKIRGSHYIPSALAPYCKVIWKDEEGNRISTDIVEELGLYDYDTIIGIKTAYWHDENASQQTDWGNVIQFVSLADTPDLYYFYINENSSQVNTGDYTFLFCSEYCSSLNTVADVKALKDKIKAQISVRLYDSTKEPIPDPDPDPTPDPVPDPNPDDEEPGHTHSYLLEKLEDSTCIKTGTKTYQCSGCGQSYTEEIPKKNHNNEKVLKKASFKENGYIGEKCKDCGMISREEILYAPKTIILSKDSYTYDGKRKKPSIKVKDEQGQVINNSNYEATYQNNQKIGMATVIVCFKGNYSGTMKKTFIIKPSPVKITKLTSKTKGFMVKWKEQKKQISGYIIEYSTSRRFAKNQTKSKTINSQKATYKTIQKLKASQTYYVRICTYKKVKVNGKTIKICSDWSKTKTVTTKKGF